MAGFLDLLKTIGGGVLKKAPEIAAATAGGAGARAQSQTAKGNQQLSQDELRQRMFQAVAAQQAQRTGQVADRAAFERDSPSVRAGQARTGDIMANMRDVTVDRPGGRFGPVNFSGGLRPSVLGPASRGAGAALASLGASKLGSDSYAIPELAAPPELTKLADPGGGKFGDVLGGISLAMQLLQGLNKNKPVDYAGGE